MPPCGRAKSLSIEMKLPARRRPVLEVSGGLIHDWVGITFVPGVSLLQTLSALQDYDRDAAYFRPEVVQSKLLASSGSEFRVFLRLKQVEVVTAVFDTEYDIRYSNLDATHAYSRSYSTRVVEVEDAGRPSEHGLPPGDDRGFLWRLDSYWRFYQADGGVYIQCNAVSLTRDMPAGPGWMFRPFIEKIPAESLRFTLESTRTALTAGTNHAVSCITKNLDERSLKKGMEMSEKPLYLTLGFVRAKNRTPEPNVANSGPFKDAVRIQDSFTAAMERKALLWLAVRIPARINSDHLTLLGFAAMFLAGASYRPRAMEFSWPAAGDGLPRGELVWRQPRWHARAPEKLPTPSLRILRRPHHRFVWSNFSYDGSWCLGVPRLANRYGHACRLPAAFHRNVSRFVHFGGVPAVLREVRANGDSYSPGMRQPCSLASPRCTCAGTSVRPFRLWRRHRGYRDDLHGCCGRHLSHPRALSSGKHAGNEDGFALHHAEGIR